jgi:hypothetical protein
VADQKNRGGQRQGDQDTEQAHQAQGANTGGAGERSDEDKRRDQQATPDDARRTATDEQR